MSPSLADLRETSEAQLFAGRRGELAVLSELLDPRSEIRIAFLHGPGGSGKSMLLSELGRRARSRGITVLSIDARRLDRAPGTLERALGGLDPGRPTLILLDTYEQISSLDGHLRDNLLPGLPSVTRLAVAGRHAPDAAWSRDGWDAISTELALGPMSDADAHEMVRKRNVTDSDLAAALVDWGRGEPLPIALACEAAKRDPDFRPEGLDADETLAERLIRQVCDGELDGQGGEVVLAAAVARFVDAPLLEEVADVPDGAAAERWLGRLSFGERIGGRLTLHERVRRALRTHAQSLRRRVADALDLAFGSSTRDQLLRQTLERGYLDPDGNHARAALDLHLSRSTYFRRLREATARLAAARLLR